MWTTSHPECRQMFCRDNKSAEKKKGFPLHPSVHLNRGCRQTYWSIQWYIIARRYNYNQKNNRKCKKKNENSETDVNHLFWLVLEVSDSPTLLISDLLILPPARKTLTDVGFTVVGPTLAKKTQRHTHTHTPGGKRRRAGFFFFNGAAVTIWSSGKCLSVGGGCY